MKGKEQEDTEKKLNDTELERNPVITTLWIGFIISVLSIIGILILSLAFNQDYTNSSFRIALGVFVIGVLILFFALILRRLRRKGIAYFVTGAITAYIGFILLSIPAILAVILDPSTLPKDLATVLYILMAVGVILIIFGFFFEAYDLNLKIIALMKKLKEAIKKIWKRINWKLVLSPWNLLSVAGITIMILAALEIFVGMRPLFWYLIGGSLILLNIIWHFRKEIWEILASIGKVIGTIFQAWWRAVKQIPQIVKKFGIWIYTKTVDFLRIIGKTLKFLIVRNYFILFILGISMLIVFYFLDKLDETNIALSVLVCGIAIVKPILDWRDHFGEDISKARMYLYKTAQKTREVLQTRKLLTRCPYCNRPNEMGKDTCWYCAAILPKCMICNGRIERGTKIARCLHCDNLYHINHLETWLRFNPKCPVCKEIIDKKEEEFLPAEFVET